ncbi:hypothetical protein ACIQZG_01205 [Lysinibacillus sp. NPDC096418]|uniref:hypothetical protein n=1 Tax=Lysinibacillus sp. NPDC096418 TaxID=3364138 RepID=UPI0038227DB1
MNNGIKIHGRIAKCITNNHFSLIPEIHGDLIITEKYSDRDIQDSNDIDVNISEILELDLSDNNRFQVFKYGDSDSSKEKSIFGNFKAQTFKERKCDISLLVFDHEEKAVFLVCGEVKKTLKIESLFEAREQIISTYIDLNLYNALLSYNSYTIKNIFFIVFEKNQMIKKVISSTQLLKKSDNGKSIPTNLLLEEYNKESIHYTLDCSRNLREVDKNLSELIHWVNSRFMFINVPKLQGVIEEEFV